MKRVLLWPVSLAAILACLCPAAPAAENTTRGVVRGTCNGIEWATGGVGVHAREALTEMQSAYNLKVSLATVDGSFLSGVEIAVFDSSERLVLHIPAAGPWVFAHLPQGRFILQATFDNVPRRQTVTTGTGLTRVMLYWPAPPGEDGL